MDKWQRVAPIALLYFFFDGLIGSLKIFGYSLVIVAANLDKVMNNKGYILLGIVIILCLILLSSFLQFYFFKYRLKAENIEIHSGIIFKKHLDLPFTRIQNVKLITPAYFRPFSFTSLELDTAGSQKSEAKIVAVSQELANSIKQKILTYQASHTDTENEADSANDIESSQEPSQEIVLNERSLRDLVIHGLTNNRVWIFLAMLAPVADPAIEYIIEMAGELGVDINAIISDPDYPVWQLSLFIISTFITAYIVVMLLSIIGSIIAFYGYTLSKKDNTYIQRSGLLSHHEVVMKLTRLQLIIRKQDWLDVIIKRTNLKFEQLGLFTQGQQPGIRSKIMVPSINDAQCNQLINDAWPDNNLQHAPFERINKRYVFKLISFLVLPFNVLLGVIMVQLNAYVMLPLLTVTFAIGCALAYCRWLRWGYHRDDNYLYIRKGLLGVSYYCFPIQKIQQVKFKQSVFLRRHHLCSVTMVTAASALSIPFIPEGKGWSLVNECLHNVESTKKNWM
ncbi:MAG: PH domain-containing protein [Psychrobium sp.]|nr:PH domain-containing protein [Psychrobium sp.]